MNLTTSGQKILYELFQQEFKEAVEENDEAHFFELFSSEQIMKPFDLSDEEIENGVLGSGNDGGCDAVFVLHNGVIVTEDMLQELNNSNNAVVDLVVIQAKREISFSEDTIRPIIGDYVSLAKFTLLEDIKLYDLTKKSVPERSTPEDGIPLLFDAIGALFSRPVETKRENYIATQFLAEEIKRMGFDGLRFESSLHRGGFNTVLFEPDKCKVLSSDIVHVNEIKIETEIPWFFNIDADSAARTDE